MILIFEKFCLSWITCENFQIFFCMTIYKKNVSKVTDLLVKISNLKTLSSNSSPVYIFSGNLDCIKNMKLS